MNGQCEWFKTTPSSRHKGRDTPPWEGGELDVFFANSFPPVKEGCPDRNVGAGRYTLIQKSLISFFSYFWGS